MTERGHLATVAASWQARQDAATAWREAVRRAHDDGVPVTTIARAAGVTRHTVYGALRGE